jgi:hypothetical protein
MPQYVCTAIGYHYVKVKIMAAEKIAIDLTASVPKHYATKACAENGCKAS